MESRWGGRSGRLLPPAQPGLRGRLASRPSARRPVGAVPAFCAPGSVSASRGSPLQPVRLQPTRPQGGLVSRALKLMTFAESRECDLGVAFWGHRHPVTHRRAGMSLGHQRLPL